MPARHTFGPDEVLLVANTRHGPEADTAGTFEPERFHDHLGDPAEALAYLRRQGFAVPAGAPRAEHLAALRELREAAQSLAGEGGAREWQRRAERMLRRASYRLDAEGELVPVSEGWDAFVSALLPGLVELRALRDRMKVCGNSNCGWLFLDRSKNRSRVWCEMASCGNRMKARRFRKRQRPGR